MLRLAVPRRDFTLSQIRYVIDQMPWLWENRHLIGGLRFTYEPVVLRFFMGTLEPVGAWPQNSGPISGTACDSHGLRNWPVVSKKYRIICRFTEKPYICTLIYQYNEISDLIC